ncbi:2'-5' RNA ligase family protein [Dactylosporangium fulvum]|uniref:2'-5' RNA ligase family protein n=1 Tax=Dactylosporangium fulvum TaxID=53359 RepID=A0ABY5VLP4_9ACTN|nr:2'-5' RNA ligase family protein [Dactylosporangium fulvum]UWP78487.1 2'-5' RNA ligase family protein [Dactylosporangium fulvum]
MQTALIVVVPEAEPVVGPLRAVLDPAASWGVPAHVTVLYPFLPPHRVDGTVLAALRDVVGATPRFGAALTRVAWFGDTVVWAAPEPDQPFRDLTTAVWRRFPETPPYGGAYDDVVPHLTIGDGAPGPRLEHAAAAVAPHLPIPFTVGAVRLISGEPGELWETVTEFPLR